jgi:DNA-binding PadR family transcriptional regulator
VARREDKRGRISIFKGREAKLNRAIFHILALKSPLTIYEVCKEVRIQKGLKHTKYTNVNRRVRRLEEQGYLEKVGTRKTRAGFQATLYQISIRGYLALMLQLVNLNKFVNHADKTGIVTALASFILEYGKL